MDDLAAEMAILDAPSSAEVSSESADVSESITPVETETESVSTQENLGEDQERTGAEAQPKPGAQPTKPGEQPTPEQQQEMLASKAAQFDKEYEGFAAGDVNVMVETLEDMFGQNPDTIIPAVWTATRFMEQRAPEQYQQFAKMILADELGQLGVSWEHLEKIAGYLKQANDRESFDELNKIAVLLKGLGHGPSTSTPGSVSESYKGYSTKVGAMLDRSMPALVREAIGERFSRLAPYDQQTVLEAVRLDVRDALFNDKNIMAAYKKLGQRYTDREGLRVHVELLMPKLRSLGPLIAKNIASKYSGMFDNLPAKPQPAKPAPPTPLTKPAVTAPRNMAEARSRNMTMADVLKATEGEIVSGSFLSQDEVNEGMSDMDVLSSRRVPLTKKPWRPGNELDQL